MQFTGTCNERMYKGYISLMKQILCHPTYIVDMVHMVLYMVQCIMKRRAADTID